MKMNKPLLPARFRVSAYNDSDRKLRKVNFDCRSLPQARKRADKIIQLGDQLGHIVNHVKIFDRQGKMLEKRFGSDV